MRSQKAAVEREKLPEITIDELLDTLVGKMYRLENDEYVRYTKEELRATLNVSSDAPVVQQTRKDRRTD